jgi:hypothetical protein
VDYLADMPAPTELPVQRTESMVDGRAYPEQGVLTTHGRYFSGSYASLAAEGELRTYYDTITAYQNRLMRPNLQKVVNFEMFSL